MPSPFRTFRCIECGRESRTRSLVARTCSPKCRAQMREREHGPTKGVSPRDYPPAVVEQVRDLYESGMTQAEVQAEIGPGVKVQNVMRRYGIQARPAQARVAAAGENHPGWKGDAATYTAFHLRVQKARGKPSFCVKCGTIDPSLRYEWANLTGDYANIDDYARMCQSCHSQYDCERRARTGARTSPARG